MEVMCCTRGVIHCNNYLIYMLFKMMVWEKENQIADKDNYFSNLKIIIAFHFFLITGEEQVLFQFFRWRSVSLWCVLKRFKKNTDVGVHDVLAYHKFCLLIIYVGWDKFHVIREGHWFGEVRVDCTCTCISFWYTCLKYVNKHVSFFPKICFYSFVIAKDF